MSVKYLYTFKRLGVEGIDNYFLDASHFHAPIDSFVLDAIGVDATWSTIDNYSDYYEIQSKIPFEKEYKEWPEYASKAKLRKDNGIEKRADIGTYKRYVQNNGGYVLNG